MINRLSLIRIIKSRFHIFSNTKFGKAVKIRNTNIKVEGGCSLIIGDNVRIINSVIELKNNSELIIGENSLIHSTTLNLNKSNCSLMNGVILQTSENKTSKIFSDSSKIQIGNNVRLIGTSIYSRFGSLLQIGDYSGCSGGTEIFCHEKIKIGKFALIAEDVCIYDTNTHSTDSIKRSNEIMESYPAGLWDKVKPTTEAISIGDNVWLGKGSAILKGTIINNNCIIGLRTVVSGGDFEENSILVSSPLRVLKK